MKYHYSRDNKHLSIKPNLYFINTILTPALEVHHWRMRNKQTVAQGYVTIIVTTRIMLPHEMSLFLSDYLFLKMDPVPWNSTKASDMSSKSTVNPQWGAPHPGHSLVLTSWSLWCWNGLFDVRSEFLNIT
jgi:hypothetical protein